MDEMTREMDESLQYDFYEPCIVDHYSEQFGRGYRDLPLDSIPENLFYGVIGELRIMADNSTASMYDLSPYALSNRPRKYSIVRPEPIITHYAELVHTVPYDEGATHVIEGTYGSDSEGRTWSALWGVQPNGNLILWAN